MARWVVMESSVLCVAGNVPVLWVGAPGSGKTEAARAIATSIGVAFEVVNLNECTPEDVSGVPYVDAKEGITRHADAEVVARIRRRAENGGLTLVFLDEIVSPLFVESRSVWLQQLAAPLRSGAMFIAACNPVEQAELGRELSLALRARFAKLEFKQSAAVFIKGHQDGYESLIPKWRLVWRENGFANLAAEMAIKAAEFLDLGGHFGECSREVLATPRSVDMAGRVLAAAKMLGQLRNEEAVKMALFGILGNAAAGLYEWLMERFTMEPSALFDKEVRDTLDEKQLVALAQAFPPWLAKARDWTVPVEVIKETITVLEQRCKQAAVLVKAALAKYRPEVVVEIVLSF